MENGIIQYLILGLIQGLTEFLPISSSAHLILLPRLLGWQDQGLAVDVAAHVGTLCAVIFYFRRDLLEMSGNWVSSGFSTRDYHARYVWFLIIATVPIALSGLFLGGLVETYLRSQMVIALATICFGMLIFIADKFGHKSREEKALTFKDIIIIGLFQVLALVPGTSRSGITITAGLLLGLERRAAARFAFLLSIPTIILAGGYAGYKLVMSQDAVYWPGVITVTVTSFILAALTIHFFIRFLDRTGLLPYVIYRMLLGCALVYLFV
ncbi:MAG: undecaprenyl-diphosphate phosphatase [Gammaproteobacteria bacterium]|nr:undecaprenyl-diphosphate phosphatase [Gammaproteobacteria bacterium]